MRRRYTIILNVFLIGATIFLAERLYTIWTSEAAQELVRSGVKEAQAHSTVTMPARSWRMPRKGFEVIPANDLFRPERTEWIAPEKKKEETTQEAVPVTPAKKMRVYGIIIADDFKQAWLLEEGNRREKPKSFSEGDTLEDGWKISAIDPDAVTISRGTEMATYNLIEEGNPKQRVPPRVFAQPRTQPGKSRVQRPAPRPRTPVKPQRSPGKAPR